MVKTCENEKLYDLCSKIRYLCDKKEFTKAYSLICEAMGNYPNAAIPHNLLGIVFEKTGDHLNAMKHFRAAWALDPTYQPANQNLLTFGSFYPTGKFAFDESDLSA